MTEEKKEKQFFKNNMMPRTNEYLNKCDEGIKTINIDELKQCIDADTRDLVIAMSMAAILAAIPIAFGYRSSKRAKGNDAQ